MTIVLTLQLPGIGGRVQLSQQVSRISLKQQIEDTAKQGALYELTFQSKWKDMQYFKKLDGLEGVPVINIHTWFVNKLSTVDRLLFSKSPLVFVCADMSTTCREYYDEKKSMLELVFAPAEAWVGRSDVDIMQATMKELERLLPDKIKTDQSLAKIIKTSRSVYKATTGREVMRPSQKSPINNFYLARDFTSQKYLASMEGAIFCGKLATEKIICDVAGGVEQTNQTSGLQPALTAAGAVVGITGIAGFILNNTSFFMR